MAPRNKTTSTPVFTKFFLSRVTVDQQPNLSIKLKISTNKLTRIKKAPEIAKMEEVRAIAMFLKDSPYRLVEDYELGLDGLSAREYKTLQTESIKASQLG